jgi:hypothetical protein
MRGAAVDHSEHRPDHSPDRGHLAAIAIAGGRQSVEVAEQFVGAVDEIYVQVELQRQYSEPRLISCRAGTEHMRKILITAVIGLAAWGEPGVAQTRRVSSPAGTAATQVGGKHDEREGYVGGRWLEIRFGRPIKRGRDLFGPADYAEALNDGAPVWRAGANVTTRLNVEAPIVIAGRTVAPGEYSVFIDLQPRQWTFVLSTWPAQATYDYENKAALWGAYDYTPDRDIVRMPMRRETLKYSFDQLSWEFLDVTDAGGKLAVIWDKQLAWVPFSLK